jgi:hypothetical protein
MHALATGRDPLEATAAAGSVLVGGSRSRAELVVAAIPIHLAVSLVWAHVLARTLPDNARTSAGALAGLAIGYLDLCVIGRCFSRVRALPLGPQLADHVLFGAVVGHLTRRSGRIDAGTP